MKVALLFTLLLSLCSPFTARADSPDDCTDELKAIAQQDSLKVACNVLDIAAQIWEGKDAVPPRLYHFGRPALLKRNVEARTIPQQDWDDYIVGDKNRRFGLAQIRRGLYGTHYLDTNGFSDSSYSRVMEIHIKDECRKPEKVATLQNLEKDPRFIAWLKKRPDAMNPKEFSIRCGDLDYESAYGSAACNSLAASFLQDADIKIIQDSIVEKSFYIRDRSCIATIRGTDEELLESFANYPSLIFDSCNQDNARNGAGVLQDLLVKSISKQKIPEQTLANLKANARLAGSRALVDRDTFIKAVDTFADCKNEDPEADCRDKVKAAVAGSY